MAGERGKFVGGLRFGVSMDTRKLSKDTKKARGIVGKFVGSVKKAIFSVKGFGAILAGGLFVRFTADAFGAIDSLAKVSDKLGVATEALAGLRLAANESGVASNTLDMALQRMVRRVAEAAIGLGEAKDALKALGLDAKALSRLAPDRQFREIAEAMSKVSDNGERIRLAFKLFDSEGVALVNTLKLGKAGLDETAQAAKDMGLAISRTAAKEVEKANDSFNRMKESLAGVFRGIAVDLAPAVEMLAKSLAKLIRIAGKGVSMGVWPIAKVGAAVVEVARGITMTQPTMSGIKDTGPRFTTPGPKYAQFRTAADMAAHRNANPTYATFKGIESALRVLSGTGANFGRAFGRSAAGLGQSLANHPANKLMLSLLSKFEVPITKAEAKRTRDNSRGTLAFAEAGSAESFRQRARTRNQNEQKKLDIKRNATLTAIKDSLTGGSNVTLSAANL